jgi:3-deoxy-D-manno-octulosonic-acid transferase
MGGPKGERLSDGVTERLTNGFESGRGGGRASSSLGPFQRILANPAGHCYHLDPVDPRRPNRLWLLAVNAAYALAALVAWPVAVVVVAVRKKYRARFWERLGLVPRCDPARKRLWVHMISVGETIAARAFVPALAEAFPEHDLVLSTTTRTGRDRAEQLFPGRAVFHWPLDLLPCVRLALARVRPSAVIQVESEWWPNFFLWAARRRVPVIIVNLRMTERGERGYRRIRPLMRAVINSCRAIGVQADLYADRLRGLGAEAARLRVTGQMKHDAVRFDDPVEGADALRREMEIAPRAPVLVAGSTGPGEEAVLLAAFADVRRRHSEARLVIVPRRPENFDDAAAAILRAGFGVLRRSTGRPEGPPGMPPVLLGDTMGELLKWYGLADVVFVGRSLLALGGSNPMEPGALGRPLVWGPHMFNFPVEAPALVAAGAARQVADARALADTIADLLTHPDRRREMGAAARAAIRAMQGATARNVALVREALREKDGPAKSPQVARQEGRRDSTRRAARRGE